MKKNEKGFGAVEGMLILVVIVLVGVVGFMVYKNHNKIAITPEKNTSTTTTPAVSTNTPTTKATADPNEGYLVVKEWGLRFKLQSGLTDLQYKVYGDVDGNEGTLAIYARPTGSKVTYRSDYEITGDAGYPTYAVGIVYRSAQEKYWDSAGKTYVPGKKLGNRYYHTAWAFNSEATGAACVGLYGDSSESNCKAESTVFQLINQGDSALLNTIELAQ